MGEKELKRGNKNRVPLYLAVDVGTGSVRAGLFNGQGQKLGYFSHPIKTRNKAANQYEQSTDDIWRALTISIRSACEFMHNSDSTEYHVAALGIDATCSLVVCRDDESFAPLSVISDDTSQVDDETYNVLLWLDRRAINEALYINESEDKAIRAVRSHFGDKISPENEPPKLLWLHRNKPHLIREGVFFDLADWVAFKCCGDSNVRSSCTVACKWGWGSNEGEEGEWSREFWEHLGLGILIDKEFHKIGRNIVKPGTRIGNMAPEIAAELGLSTACKVASPMIDAHAGALWSLGVESDYIKEVAPSIENRLAIIAGTSTCFIELSKNPLFVPGVWGPFRDAVLPGFHVTEGGQSVTGKLLEKTVEHHPSFVSLCDRVGPQNVYETLAEMTDRLIRNGEPDPAADVHCLDFHAGNRSPLADPTLTGAMVGLTLSEDEHDLAVQFRATMQALCYGARHIIDVMSAAGHEVKVVMACGGLCKSMLFLTELSDCLSLPVALSSEEDTVLLGGAILAKTAYLMTATAEDHVTCLLSSAAEMTRLGTIIQPNEQRREYHDRKYAVYKKLFADLMSYRIIMNGDR